MDLHERALRHILKSVTDDPSAPEVAIYLGDVAAVALGEADPTPSDKQWMEDETEHG